LGSAKQNFLIAKRQAMPACDDNDDGLNFLSFPRKTFREKLSEQPSFRWSQKMEVRFEHTENVSLIKLTLDPDVDFINQVSNSSPSRLKDKFSFF
jgi:hypothetical protein